MEEKTWPRENLCKSAVYLRRGRQRSKLLLTSSRETKRKTLSKHKQSHLVIISTCVSMPLRHKVKENHFLCFVSLLLICCFFFVFAADVQQTTSGSFKDSFTLHPGIITVTLRRVCEDTIWKFLEVSAGLKVSVNTDDRLLPQQQELKELRSFTVLTVSPKT